MFNIHINPFTIEEKLQIQENRLVIPKNKVTSVSSTSAESLEIVEHRLRSTLEWD